MTEKLRALIDKILTKMRLIKYKEQILYLIVGGGTTLVDWVIFTVFDLFVPKIGNDFIKEHISENILAYSIAWLGAVIFAYVLSRLFVFERTDERVALQFIKFFASRVPTLALSLAGDFILCTKLGMNEFLGKLISSVAVIVINYITSKLFVFRKKKSSGAEDGNGQD